ncbi:MAG: DNA primase small subunit PriS [Candidatus Verstraetearchaeota archaeon]|nr:DNA primase small subunit PriS [Candidatus Verstraetearchaeota archaeon]
MEAPSLLRKLFKQYYDSCSKDDFTLRSFTEREFAFLTFDSEGMIRHKSFSSPEELLEYMRNSPPAHVYYSSAYYETPAAEEMDAKGWKGADLIFDIDADHIATPCKEEHDTWKCLDCGAEGRGMPPESCPNCASKKIEEFTWMCERCLEAAKAEVLKLIEEFLIPDFGVSEKEIEICFSGHRGYHLHVECEDFRHLNSEARREIADYVRGVGIVFEDHGFTRLGSTRVLLGPSLTERGWRGRVARGVYTVIDAIDMHAPVLYMPARDLNWLRENRQAILEALSKEPPFWAIFSKLKKQSLKELLKAAVTQCACNIDERVTIDIKRLIRMPNSLHGKTGLKVVKISYADLDSFKPLKDAIVFRKGYLKLHVKRIPKLRVGEVEVGPLEDKVVELPMAAAVYILARGAGEPVWR